ncbi:SMI1/KNR4 family protein [Sphingobacterium sp. Lzh-3]|uniref:SMI1/KNR4 family protein n=1 Tax=unclassified Sphingobacterium TaxID=2609468 RepID=UPI0029545909|nr:SMI1/KNR4 family protein [Sphingobacterium sp. UGAL515B_05]WON92463.1 SMI1/KNR4 family protein [Sphingobacterium sp. UGAL515B_05]
MDSLIALYFGDFIKGLAVSADLINRVQKDLGFNLPDDYISMLKEFNVSEGEVGYNS